MKAFLPLLLLGSSGALWAQSGELWFSGGASILLNRGIGSPASDGQPHDVRFGDDYRVGFRFAVNSSGHLGHEIQYAYIRTGFICVPRKLLRDVGRAGT